MARVPQLTSYAQLIIEQFGRFRQEASRRSRRHQGTTGRICLGIVGHILCAHAVSAHLRVQESVTLPA